MFRSAFLLPICWMLLCPPFLGNAQEVDFVSQIAPILEERCWHCHGEDEQESGLRLDLRGRMLRGGDSGLAALVPKKPESSYLLEVVKQAPPLTYQQDQ